MRQDRFGPILKVEDYILFHNIYNAFKENGKLKPTKNIGIKVESGEVRLDRA